MLAEYPDACSIFEYFNGLDATRRFSATLDGPAFAELIAAEQPFVTAVLRRGYPVSEITYPFDAGGRQGRGDPLPWILVSTLPRLTDEPDALFAEVIAFARSLAEAPVVEHHRALFDWLTHRLGRALWIERAGSSIDYLGSLYESFPEASFLHIHRDGRECALSMREHHAYRLPISILYQAPTDDGVPLAQLGPLDLHAEPTGDDPISRVLASRPSADYFGRYWNDQIERGFAALPHIAPGRRAEVRFEDLVADPRGELGRIAGFFDLDPTRDGWIERAAALVRGVPPTRFPTLPEAEREALETACASGHDRLGRPVRLAH